MTPKKIVILIFCMLTLLVELLVILIPNEIISTEEPETVDRAFYPFLKYPMYAEVKKPGDKIVSTELRVYVEKNDKFVIINPGKLKITHKKLLNLIRSTKKIFGSDFAKSSSSYKDFILLKDLIYTQVSKGKHYFAEIWEREYEMGDRGIKDFNAAWKMKFKWEYN